MQLEFFVIYKKWLIYFWRYNKMYENMSFPWTNFFTTILSFDSRSNYFWDISRSASWIFYASTLYQYYMIFKKIFLWNFITYSALPIRALLLARQKQALRHAKIDRFFLILFPLLFLIFNVVYWLAYYYAHPVITVDAEQQTWVSMKTSMGTVVELHRVSCEIKKIFTFKWT